MTKTTFVTLLAGERGSNEGSDNVLRNMRSHITGRQTEHVCIKEAACVLRHLRVPADSCAYTGVHVSTHAHAVSCIAKTDTKIAFSFLYSGSHGVCIIRKITTLHRIAAEIQHFGSFTLQEQMNHGFQSKTCVVTGQRDGHFI